MAKILISSLGVGRLERNNTSNREYTRAIYKFQDSGAKYETPFVAAALSEYLRVDKLFLVGTCKSMWEEVYRYFASESKQKLDENYWVDLGEKVAAFQIGNKTIDENHLIKVNKAIDGYLRHLRNSATGGSHCYIIDYGLNETELWSNFDVFMRIGESLEENDEIYLDITHGFRSIPLFMYLMMDLINVLQFKNIKLAGLFYGMLDARADFGYAPIVDLSPLFNISMWIRGAYNFINFGNGYLLADLIDNEKVSAKFKNISEQVNINYINDFKREIDRLNSLLEAGVADEPVVKYMQPYLKSFITRFKGISSSGRLQFALAQWYFENNRYATGYICLAESIITKILEIYRATDSRISWAKRNRDKIKNLIYKQEFLQRPEYKQLHEEYDAICKIRNRIAHAGFTEKSSFEKDIKIANIHLNNVERYVFNNRALEKLPEEIPFSQIDD
ncbi:MAG: TIGR02221 family CRISPR-associated protein [Firmicutes bacterium]|nr:TIGR02221 family CRISPR-associated protein [Bacillota bacterium]